MARENDIVLLYLEDSPVTFARVEEINPDVRKDWFTITLLMLQIPVQEVTWILKDAYINGEEFFMGGKRMRLEVVKRPLQEVKIGPGAKTGPESGIREGQASVTGDKTGGRSKVISLADIRKSRENQ
ncbi:MAG: hypothetical protein V1793_17655 [Pseudomonadota bacterium]